MQINPTDKSISIVGDIDFLLFGDSSSLNTDYSLVDRIRNINIAWDEVVTELYRADPNHKWDDTTNTDFPIATTDLSSGTDHYVTLDSALVIHRVRMANRTGNSFITLTPKLRSELTDTDLNSTGEPTSYYKLGGAIFPLPVPDYSVDAGVELEFQRGGNHFATSDTTASPGFNSQFHQILSLKAAKRYAMANGMSEKVQMLDSMLNGDDNEEGIVNKMTKHYQMRSPDEKPKFKLKRNTSNYGL